MKVDTNLESVSSRVHICVLSPSAIAPILSPLLDRRLGCEKAIVIATADNKKRFESLKAVLKSHQIGTELFEIASAFDINQLRIEISKLMMSLLDEQPFVNVTVGSKPLSIVLHEQAVVLDFPVYYLNVDDQLSWFWPREQQTVALEDRIKCVPFLLAHGIKVISFQTPQMRPELVNFFKEHAFQSGNNSLVIRDLNRFAYLGKDDFKCSLTKKDMANEVLYDFLNGLDVHGCLKLTGHHIDFIDEDHHFFINGGWLEAWVHVHLDRLKKQLPALQHHLASVELEDVETGIKNEIDNLVLYNNNLYVLECETVRFKPGFKPATDVIYKLDTLQKQLGGALGKGVLISLYEISEHELDRAKMYGIKVIHGSQLLRLEHHLTAWLTDNR